MSESVPEQALKIRDYFQQRYRSVNAPATAAEIRRAERKIGLQFPPILRELYLLCNGFRGPSDAPYLGKLFGASESVTNYMRMLRECQSDEVTDFIAFGEDTAFHVFAIRELPSQLIQVVSWDPEAGLIDRGSDLFRAFLYDERICREALDGES